MLICEMASYYKHQGKSLLEVYIEIQEKLGYHIESQYSYAAEGMSGVEKIKKLMSGLRNSSMDYIADEKVVIKEDYVSLTKIENGKVSALDYEQSDVLRYVFEDGSFVAIRPSGTEHKVKFYFAVCGKTQQAAQERHDKVKQFVIDLIK
jgi:phosphoglucomutase